MKIAWQDSLFNTLSSFAPENYGNTTDPCLNPYNSTCDSITVNNFMIASPALIPCCIGAALIGFHAFFVFSKLSNNVRGKKIYALVFAMFGTMMSDAAFNDCILSVHGNYQDWIHLFFGILDVGLTSSIGATFGFCGLVDIGWLQEGPLLWTLLGITYIALFGGWYYTFTENWMEGFLYLYVGVIAVGCGIYCILEFINLIASKNRTGTGWVVVAGITGGVGLAAIFFQAFDTWLCHHFGCYFGGNTLWFILTDVAMYSCYRYFLARASSSQKQTEGYIPVSTVELNSM